MKTIQRAFGVLVVAVVIVLVAVFGFGIGKTPASQLPGPLGNVVAAPNLSGPDLDELGGLVVAAGNDLEGLDSLEDPLEFDESGQ